MWPNGTGWGGGGGGFGCRPHLDPPQRLHYVRTDMRTVVVCDYCCDYIHL